MFTVLFALARTVGWIAQWKEMLEDPHQKIGRPRQIYTGADRARLYRCDGQAQLRPSAHGVRLDDASIDRFRGSHQTYRDKIQQHPGGPQRRRFLAFAQSCRRIRSSPRSGLRAGASDREQFFHCRRQRFGREPDLHEFRHRRRAPAGY